MAVHYAKFVSADLDQDNSAEVMVITPGDSPEENALAALYWYSDGGMIRSRQAGLSEKSENIKRIMVSSLHGGKPAVYVASSVDEDAIITDVFAIRDGKFTNVSQSNESGTSVQTLRNYYVYADDIDSDGVLELPNLITMRPIRNSTSAEQQYLIRWYAMDLNGAEHTKRHTFHNYVGGWYLELEDGWAERVSVVQAGGTFWFYVWDVMFEKAELVFSLHVLTGADREEEADMDNRFVLHRTEGVIYAAQLESGAANYLITKEDLAPCFHLIYQAWKTGET
jgi:hypothetical protein